MINSVEAVGRFQKIVFGITMWLLAASIVLTIVIFVRDSLTRRSIHASRHNRANQSPFLFCRFPLCLLYLDAVPAPIHILSCV